MNETPPTYVLVDGENIDVTLGSMILGGRPDPEKRPRWERVLDFAGRIFEGEPSGLFFINASNGTLPMSFIQALYAVGFKPIPLAGDAIEKVVDVGIKRTLEAIKSRKANVLLLSHDRDFVPELEELLDSKHKVGVVAFTDFISGEIRNLTAKGLQIFDLEYDVKAFNVRLPRTQIIQLSNFDPEVFL